MTISKQTCLLSDVWRLRKAFPRATVGLMLFAIGVSSAQAAQTIWLSSLDLSKTVQSTGRAQIDKSYTGKPLCIAGRKFDRGLGTHAVSRLVIDLKGGADRFAAQVGLDDHAGKNATCNGSVVFGVFGDGRLLWNSGVMRWKQPAKLVDLNLKGIKSLLLLVGDARDGINCDHADWADAKFEVSGAMPQTLAAPPQSQGVVLTPPPPATPRINGARVFGVRPGHPFLFTIPATGRRPMEFAVNNLPAGLKVDSHTGQMTGVLRDRGEYRVTFRAQNALGQAERNFKIVCGDTLALTPHMGWNSWYIWRARISDKIIREAADAMVANGMIDHGYAYVNMDACWSVKLGSTDPTLNGPPRDAQGNINPNPRFPDMQALTEYIHSKGLKAGIYTGPVPVYCAAYPYVGSYQHEAQDGRRFAQWGFDFLKYDWCNSTNVPPMGAILQKLDRDVVLNVVAGSVGGMHTAGKWGRKAGVHSWRTARDLGGAWGLIVEDVFGLYGRNEVQCYSGPGGWNDPDYLCLGYVSPHAKTSLSPSEQYSYVSIWCLAAAPLIYSGDITRLDDFTLGLLTNVRCWRWTRIRWARRPCAWRNRVISRCGPRIWRMAARLWACSISMTTCGPVCSTWPVARRPGRP